MGITLEEALHMVGPGWAKLLGELYARLPDDTIVADVKEKFGELRFYVDNSSSAFLELIMKKENESRFICELCGEPGELRDIGGSWMKTLCDFHYSEWKKTRGFEDVQPTT